MKNNVSEHFTHVGWVPCVLGHLDFGLMKVGLSGGEIFGVIPTKDKNEIAVNFAHQGDSDDNGRRIIVSTWHDWMDTIQNDGKFRVVLSAESNRSLDMDNRYLKGRLCIMPKSYEKTHKALYDYYMDDVININETSLNKSNTQQQELNEYWKNTSDKLSRYDTSDCKGNEVHFVEFHIDHSGITHLSYLPNTNVDESVSASEKAQYGILRKAFYYIKYTLHTHKYHTKESDALTTIIRMDKKDKTNDGKRLVAQLKRELTRIKRTQNASHYRRDESAAHGIIGYLRSLVATCHYKGLLTEEQQSRECSWLEGASGSFTAQHEIMTIQKNNKDSVKASSRQLATLLLASTGIPVLLWVNFGNSDNKGNPITAAYFQNASIVEYIIFTLVIFFGVLITAKLLETKPRLAVSNSQLFLLLPKVLYEAGYKTILISAAVTFSFTYTLWEYIRPYVFNLLSSISN